MGTHKGDFYIIPAGKECIYKGELYQGGSWRHRERKRERDKEGEGEKERERERETAFTQQADR